MTVCVFFSYRTWSFLAVIFVRVHIFCFFAFSSSLLLFSVCMCVCSSRRLHWIKLKMKQTNEAKLLPVSSWWRKRWSSERKMKIVYFPLKCHFRASVTAVTASAASGNSGSSVSIPWCVCIERWMDNGWNVGRMASSSCESSSNGAQFESSKWKSIRTPSRWRWWDSDARSFSMYDQTHTAMPFWQRLQSTLLLLLVWLSQYFCEKC